MKPRLPLHNKIALITGASRGIGLAIAQALGGQGCDVIITGREALALQKAAKQIGTKAVPVVCDVGEPKSVQNLLATVKKRFGRLDILINNAGVAHANIKVADLPLQTWNGVIETNLTALFLVTQAALPLMKSGAAIVNNLSVAAKRVFPGLSAYNAAKHGALGFTDTLREELRDKGIRVIALLPGATDTEIWDEMWPDAPRKKMMSAKTVAQAVVNALALPEDCTLEELVIRPSVGTL